MFANLDWSVPNTPTLLASPLERYLIIMANKCDTGAIEDLHVQMISPMILAAKTAATKEDNPTWWQAMNGPYAEEYWKAAQIEIETLERILAWTVVPRTDNITNVLPSTWAFKLKRYPMVLSRSSKDASVLVETSKFTVLTSSRPTAQLYNGPLFV
jgi:hypothetical protein